MKYLPRPRGEPNVVRRVSALSILLGPLASSCGGSGAGCRLGKVLEQ